MPNRNAEVVDLLQTIGDLMELAGEESYRARAYREAARQLDQLADDIDQLVAEGRLTSVKGVGPSIARTVEEYLATGRSQSLERLRRQVPESLVELLGLRHFGPARLAKVHRALGISTLDQLEAAARSGQLERLPGFGRRSVEQLLASIQSFRAQRHQIPRYLAEPVAAIALHSLRQMAQLDLAEVVGALRRLADVTESIDLLAAGRYSEVAEAFGRLTLIHEVQRAAGGVLTGTTRERYPLRLFIVPPALWAQALVHFTGSEAHTAQLRERAVAAGLRVAPEGSLEEGTWPGLLLEPDGHPLVAADEPELYRRLGLPWITPELREGRGELEAAGCGRLPRLIELRDVRGDLHVHSTWSDGHHSIEQMARYAQRLGREYLAIADHSQSLGVARGLTLQRLAEQRAEIERVDALLDGIRLLSSVELDIRSDGTLDYPDDVLAQFAFVTASLHSGFQQSPEQLTARVIAAIRSRYVDSIGHLTGRMLGRRDPLEMDVEAILQAAAETETAIEINAWPNRLDVNEQHARRAKELGVKLVINTDAHAAEQQEYMHYGVELARRAWLEPADVLNTLPLDDLLARCARSKRRA